MSPQQLKPNIPDHETVLKRERKKRGKQKQNFDNRRRAILLPKLPAGQKVWISDPRQQGIVEQRHSAPRSYIVKSPAGVYRRNRKFLHPLPFEETQIQIKNSSNTQDEKKAEEENVPSVEQNIEMPENSNSEITRSSPPQVNEPEVKGCEVKRSHPSFYAVASEKFVLRDVTILKGEVLRGWQRSIFKLAMALYRKGI